MSTLTRLHSEGSANSRLPSYVHILEVWVFIDLWPWHITVWNIRNYCELPMESSQIWGTKSVTLAFHYIMYIHTNTPRYKQHLPPPPNWLWLVAGDASNEELRGMTKPENDKKYLTCYSRTNVLVAKTTPEEWTPRHTMALMTLAAEGTKVSSLQKKTTGENNSTTRQCWQPNNLNTTILACCTLQLYLWHTISNYDMVFCTLAQSPLS